MNSEHVEVLRRMRNEWPLATDEGPALDAAIAFMSAPKSRDAESKLAEAGVFAGHHGLRGLAHSDVFWEKQPYGTRLYYGDGGMDYLHRGVLKTAVEILDAAQQPPAEAHCTTCSCVPGMTPAVRFDTTPAEKEGAVRDRLIRMGWTPPMSSDPIEAPGSDFDVLRDVYMTKAQREAFDRIRFAAIASLSAPRPPAEAQERPAKPAEVQPEPNWCRTCGRRPHDPVAALCPDTHHRKASPPRASVGDSLLQTALRNLPQYISKSGLDGPDKHSAMQCFEVLRDALAQRPTAEEEAQSYPVPRNRKEAASLARLALAHLGVIDAHIEAAVARCETDLAAQQGGDRHG